MTSRLILQSRLIAGFCVLSLLAELLVLFSRFGASISSDGVIVNVAWWLIPLLTVFETLLAFTWYAHIDVRRAKQFTDIEFSRFNSVLSKWETFQVASAAVFVAGVVIDVIVSVDPIGIWPTIIFSVIVAQAAAHFVITRMVVARIAALPACVQSGCGRS